MGLGDIFRTKEMKAKILELESLLTPEQQEIIDINAELQQKRNDLLEFESKSDKEMNKRQRTIDSLLKKEATILGKIERLDAHIANLQKEVFHLNDEISMQEFGLYAPMYEAMSSALLKVEIESCRQRQKEMIKNEKACLFVENWTVNGSKAEGKRMTKNNIKQILRSFNNECDAIIDKVKFNNYSAIEKRISTSAVALNKMNVINKVSLANDYVGAKLEELRLVHEYAMRKEEEKEIEREQREELKEQRKLEAEIRQAREKLMKEAKHFSNAIDEVRLRLATVIDESEKTKLQNKLTELEHGLEVINQDQKQVDYRESNTRAGYVYIISNVGSFGEGVYKIGVTRRLEPMDRIRELGDASVPFKFDVHALIFSEDAPTLEGKLHQAFSQDKLNLVNPRREFFRASLEAVEKIIRENFNDTFELNYMPDAEEYRISMQIRNGKLPADNLTSSSSLIFNILEDDEELVEI